MLDASPDAAAQTCDVDLANGADSGHRGHGEILIDDEGRAYSTSMEDDAEALVWGFQVIRPLAAADASTIEPPPLNVEEVVGRALKKIVREGRREGPGQKGSPGEDHEPGLCRAGRACGLRHQADISLQMATVCLLCATWILSMA